MDDSFDLSFIVDIVNNMYVLSIFIILCLYSFFVILNDNDITILEFSFVIMKLQFMSDLHLETYKNPFPIEPCAPNLALIGDICYAHHKNLIPFLEKCSESYENVIYVPGNHEYYGYTLHEIESYLEELCLELNIHYLQCKRYMIDDVLISGCTLWSPPTKAAFDTKNKRYWLKDFTQEQMINEYEKHCIFLEESLKIPNKQLFLTHYAPLIRMNGIYQHWESVSMFASELKHLFTPPLTTWLCGHVHQNLTLSENNIPCISNCFGYPHELNIHESFDLHKYIEI